MDNSPFVGLDGLIIIIYNIYVRLLTTKYMKKALFGFKGTAAQLLRHLHSLHFGVNPTNGQWEYLGADYYNPDLLA